MMLNKLKKLTAITAMAALAFTTAEGEGIL